MMDHWHAPVAAVLLATVAGCGTEAPDTGGEGALVQTTVEGWQFGEPLALGGLNPESDYLVYGAAAVVEDRSGRFYVLNAGDGRVASYDADGSFLRTIGGVGQGPGEFTSPVGVAIGGYDAVFVLDAARFSLLEYGLDGGFRRNVQLDLRLGIPVAVAAGTEGRLFVEYRPMTGISEGSHMTVVALDPASGASRPVLQVAVPEQLVLETDHDGTRSLRPINQPFAPVPSWTVAPDGALLYGDGASYEVRRAAGGRTEPLFRDADRRASPLTEATRREFLERNPDLATAADQIKFPDTMPHYTTIRSGPGGSIWLRVRTGGHGERWNVHGALGEPLGLVELRPSARVVGLSRNALYVVSYDAYDAETLLRIPFDRL